MASCLQSTGRSIKTKSVELKICLKPLVAQISIFFFSVQNWLGLIEGTDGPSLATFQAIGRAIKSINDILHGCEPKRMQSTGDVRHKRWLN